MEKYLESHEDAHAPLSASAKVVWAKGLEREEESPAVRRGAARSDLNHTVSNLIVPSINPRFMQSSNQINRLVCVPTRDGTLSN